MAYHVLFSEWIYKCYFVLKKFETQGDYIILILETKEV